MPLDLVLVPELERKGTRALQKIRDDHLLTSGEPACIIQKGSDQQTQLHTPIPGSGWVENKTCCLQMDITFSGCFFYRNTFKNAYHTVSLKVLCFYLLVEDIIC